MISTSRRATRPRPTATCVVCGRTISVSGFQDVTAAGEVTRTYRAWCPVNSLHRGQDDPTPHWCHPAGRPESGEF